MTQSSEIWAPVKRGPNHAIESRPFEVQRYVFLLRACFASCFETGQGFRLRHAIADYLGGVSDSISLLF